jgi:hypothetical protein
MNVTMWRNMAAKCGISSGSFMFVVYAGKFERLIFFA